MQGFWFRVTNEPKSRGIGDVLVAVAAASEVRRVLLARSTDLHD